jgi:lipid-binding SYLF domain-containing protein
MKAALDRSQALTAALLAGVLFAALTLGGCASTPASDSLTPAEKRARLLQMRDATVYDMFEIRPQVRDEMQRAVGYAVFEASQVNVVLYVGAMGAGVMVDNANGRETFMTMKRAGTGPGVGYKSYRQLMIFKDRKVFDTFTTMGADVGASADATLKTSGTAGVQLDGSSSFNPYLTVYQITDRGALLQANWGGVAYLPDSELNATKP